MSWLTNFIIDKSFNKSFYIAVVGRNCYAEAVVCGGCHCVLKHPFLVSSTEVE